MFCKKCGKELENGTQFCPHCGESQAAAPAPAPTAAPNPAPAPNFAPPPASNTPNFAPPPMANTQGYAQPGGVQHRCPNCGYVGVMKPGPLFRMKHIIIGIILLVFGFFIGGIVYFLIVGVQRNDVRSRGLDCPRCNTPITHLVY